VVTTDGKLARLRIVGATHAEFVLAALRALADWRFTPRMQGDLPLESPVDGEVSFIALDGEVSAADVLKDNGFTMVDTGTALAALPAPVVAVDAAWPFDMLVNGEGGSAAVDLQVSAAGVVTEAQVREASSPAVGAALLAAVTGWSFNPARDEHGAVTVGMTKRAAFLPIPPEPAEELRKDPTVRLVLAIRAGEVGGAKGLDEKLTPIYRVAPQYPLALAGKDASAGNAEIEFVIDREGRARLPRIVSASREEFGWAAATAVAQWVFKPPHRKGEAVDVKVRIPFDFKPPAS
jgi:TonB family protein